MAGEELGSYLSVHSQVGLLFPNVAPAFPGSGLAVQGEGVWQAFLIVTCGVGIQWVGAQDGRSPVMHSLASKSHPTPNANASFSLPPHWQLLLCASCMPGIEIQPHNEVGPISNVTL